MESLESIEVKEEPKEEIKETPKKNKRKDILVRAKIDKEKQKHGFYNNRRIFDGEEFTIKSMKDFSEKWMVKI